MGDRLRLEREWRQRMGDNPKSLELFNAFYVVYSDTDRHYHGVAHIKAMLWDLEGAKMLTDTNYLATWFHDAVYVAGMPDNEEKSAAWAKEALPELGVNADIINVVHDRVIATKHHQPMGDVEADSFLDADMAILGAPEEVYAAYIKNVRAEFEALPDDMFNTGRAAFLKNVLETKRIFHTEHFHDRYEAQARANIASELEHLSNFI
jgi:predicted metal-dependent HD superfamily phosphohydrolase